MTLQIPCEQPINEEMTARAGCGTSARPEPRRAGAEAAAEAVAALAGEAPALVLLFARTGWDLDELLAGVREATGDAPLLGCTSSGHYAGGAYQQPASGVAVLALPRGDRRFGVACARGARDRPEDVGAEVARLARAAADRDGRPCGTLLLHTDGLAGDQERILRGVHRALGSGVPVVGAAASDDRAQAQTLVFCGGEVLADACVAAWIASPQPLRVVSGHGWTPTGTPLLVTAATGPELRELDGRPARDAYYDLLGIVTGMPEGERADLINRHPLGILQPDGSWVIRHVRARADASGLRLFAPVPLNAAVQVMAAGLDDLLAVCGPLVADSLGGRSDASAVLAFSCLARYTILGDRVVEEVDALQAEAGDVPVVGFYTYGEFARTSSVVGFHNASISAVAL
jgi:hypothetical protein